jgi:17beta-estradiol 17-dehydrogenase / very-long-chain 3-oxoacyl-CoA reductase
MDDPQRIVTLALAGVGGLYISWKAFSFIRLIFSLFILPGKSVSQFWSDSPILPLIGKLSSFGPKGSWALVTGASDGIGLEFASQLAAKGFNLILASRTESKLSTLAKSLEDKYKVETKVVAIDFSASENDRSQGQAWSALGSLAKSLDIAILVNNVGRSHDIPVPFADTPEEERNDIININVHSTLRVTALVLPGMRERKRGLVLSMGSFGGLLPTPLLATYSGSKAFLQQWSSAVGAEVAKDGITVELVQSYLVTSAMSKIRKPSALIPNPRGFVKSTLGKVGRTGGAQGFASSSTPYWSHGLAQWVIGLVGFNNHFVVAQNLGFHEAIRKRALKKAARDGKKQS